MSKVIITADFHFGKPGRLRDCLWAARAIKEYARDHKIEDILVCGDLFHDRVNLNIEVGVQVLSFFDEVRELGQNWVVFPGNHDMFNKNSWDVNPLFLMKEHLTIIDGIKCFSLKGQRFWVLPFIHFENVYMKALSKIEERYQDRDILLTHIGVNSAIMNYCFLCRNWNVVNFNNSKFSRVYTGHFHCNQEIDNKVYYPGSPIAFNFDEGLVDHGFYVLDLETHGHEFVEIIQTGKKYLEEQSPIEYRTITDDQIPEIDQRLIRNSKIRIHLSREYTSDELSYLKNNVLESGALSVDWMKTKEEEIDVDIIDESDIRVDNSIDLLRTFYEIDQPTDIDKDLLLTLAHRVVEVGDQLLVTDNG